MNHQVLFVLLAGAMIASAASTSPPTRIDFNRDVRPILSDNCYPCHGPDARHREGKLRLDLRDAALSTAAIVPGQPEKSTVIQRIFTQDPVDLMPPPDSHKQLTARQKDILRRWIVQGAEYQQHWSYVKPVKAAIPPGENAVDSLVQRRLKDLGFQPAAPADRRTLIRRLAFDLLGLPPSPEQVAAFVGDTSPDAYPKLVDRLLKSSHYGERMALGWLDVVRFADTIGYHSDNPRNVWPYRDWVIRSFNANKRFDRFTLEQIAGDLLPDADQESRVGSAFNRLLLTTEEGGAQPQDYEQRMLTDRVRAIGAAWLGQTTGCAQCHDHKFDPITQRDFYSLGAFFADLQEPIIGRREEGLAVGQPEQAAQLAKLETALTVARRNLESVRPQLDAAQQQWEADLVEYRITLPELEPQADVAAEEKQRARKVTAALASTRDARSPADALFIRDYFLSRVTRLHAAERDAVAQAEQARNAFRDPLPKCLVSIRAETNRVVRILPRGNWMDTSGEVVKAAFPRYLPQPPVDGRELTRLDLAQWLVSRENPLTARVVMNRLWKQLFGSGLSKVLDDLGAQGELPPNQPLLDWLACEFMDSGWDFQHLVRLIVSSQTYQQASTAPPALTSADPENRELARQSAFRLDAEFVRDNALAISGLLVPTLGGPSVRPYQPEGYWENLNFPTREYVPEPGGGQYRRGLYVWWQRSFLHPSLLAFDAPSREEACAERTRSNLPQQALVLLNDPTYLEAARVFAGRILTEASGDVDARIAWAWQQALQREPSAAEASTLRELLEQHRTVYRPDPAATRAFLAVGFAALPAGIEPSELAAWTHLARVLLNLHESITRP